MRRTRRFLLLFTFSVALAGSAHAQSPNVRESAKSLQEQGLASLRKGEHQQALSSFRQAYALVPSPKILFNMALAHRGLGQNAEALLAFERFLDEAPYAPRASRADAQKSVAALRQKVGYIDVNEETAGVAVRIDGRDVGHTPFTKPFPVEPGSHEVELRHARGTHQAKLAPVAGQRLSVRVPAVALEPTANATPAPLTPMSNLGESDPAARTRQGDEPTIAEVAEARPGRDWRRTGAWSATGIGAALLVTGVAAHLTANGKYDEFNEMKAPNGTGQCARNLPNAGGGSCSSLLDGADSRRKLAIGAYVGAGVSAAVAGALFYLTGRDASEARDLACVTTFGKGASLSCGLTF